MNITIAGARYVGLSNAMLITQNYQVIVYDFIPERIEQLNDMIVSNRMIDEMKDVKDKIYTCDLFGDD
jgi:UDPglucose 6-dehydrogenase